MKKAYMVGQTSYAIVDDSDVINMVIPLKKSSVNEALKLLKDKDIGAGIWSLSIFAQQLNALSGIENEHGEK